MSTSPPPSPLSPLSPIGSSADAHSVLGQADRLMKRPSLGGTAQGAHDPAHSADGDIPVLRELLSAGKPAPFNPPSADPPKAVTIDDRIRHAIIKEVLLDVLPKLEGKLSHDLSERLLHNITPAVNAAVTVAVADLRLELANAVGDAVNRAIHAVLREQQNRR